MEEKLARRIAWFAPWTWKPWKQKLCLAAVLLPIVYGLSAGPALLLIDSGGEGAPMIAFGYRPLLCIRYLTGGHRSHFGQATDLYMNLWHDLGWSATKYEFSRWRVEVGFGEPPSSVGWTW